MAIIRNWRLLGAATLASFVLASCDQAQDGAGLSENRVTASAQASPPGQSAKMLPVPPVTAVAAGLSIASSLKSLFGHDSDRRDLKAIRKKLDEISSQNLEIQNTLNQIVAILSNLGLTVRQNVRLESIFEKQAALVGESRQLYDTWLAEIDDRRAERQALERYRRDILPDVRDITGQLMDKGYGYSAYDTVGHGMLLDMWMSRRLSERPSLRRSYAQTYLDYFDRALSSNTPDSPGQKLAEAQAQAARMKAVLDAADAQIGQGWEVQVRSYQTSTSSGNSKYGRVIITKYIAVFEKITGNQDDGYVLSKREDVIKTETTNANEPSERSGTCPKCREIEANTQRRSLETKALNPDPADPAANTPAARAPYWNTVRSTLQKAQEDSNLWQAVTKTIELYREEARVITTRG
jgi:hypothetical protein